jgi:hypothetical protein
MRATEERAADGHRRPHDHEVVPRTQHLPPQPAPQHLAQYLCWIDEGDDEIGPMLLEWASIFCSTVRKPVTEDVAFWTSIDPPPNWRGIQ